MISSTLNKQKRKKKSSKAVTEPEGTNGTNVRETSGSGGEIGNAAPRINARKSSRQATRGRARRGAKKVLRNAVQAAVLKNPGKLAEALVDKAKGGDMRGAEMVLSLMGLKKKEAKDAKKNAPATRSGPNADDLPPSEPEWDEEMDRIVDLVTAMQT